MLVLPHAAQRLRQAGESPAAGLPLHALGVWLILV